MNTWLEQTIHGRTHRKADAHLAIAKTCFGDGCGSVFAIFLLVLEYAKSGFVVASWIH